MPRFAVTVALLILAGPAVAQEKIENSEFTNWSRFKKGTSVTLKTTSEFGKMTTESVMTTTLLEVGADKLVIETSSTVKANGMEFKSPPIKRDVAKTITVPKVDKKVGDPTAKPDVKMEEGTETIKVAGTEMKAKWIKSTFEAQGNKTEMKMWMSDDVPGNLLKSVTKTTGQFASTTTTELVEFKKP